MRNIADALSSKLVKAGLRLTHQRLALADLLFAGGNRHVTAEMLYAEARQKRAVSLATVYNTLHSFAAHGLVREIALYGSKTWFDTRTGPHFHFYIESEDILFDVPDELIAMTDILAPRGTMIVGLDVVVKLEKAAPNGNRVGTEQFEERQIR